MYIDDFDLGQVDDCGDGYFNDWQSNNELTAEDYADIFLENFN